MNDDEVRFQFKLKREYFCSNLFKPVSYHCQIVSVQKIHFRVGVKTVIFSEKKTDVFKKHFFHQKIVKCLLDNLDQKWQVRIEKVQFHVKMIVRKLFIFESKMCNLDSEFYIYSKIIIFVNNLDKRRYFWLVNLFFTRAKSAKKTIFRWKRSFLGLKFVILNKNSHFPRFWLVLTWFLELSRMFW